MFGSQYFMLLHNFLIVFGCWLEFQHCTVCVGDFFCGSAGLYSFFADTSLL